MKKEMESSLSNPVTWLLGEEGLGYGIYIINYEDACYSCNQVSS